VFLYRDLMPTIRSWLRVGDQAGDPTTVRRAIGMGCLRHRLFTTARALVIQPFQCLLGIKPLPEAHWGHIASCILWSDRSSRFGVVPSHLSRLAGPGFLLQDPGNKRRVRDWMGSSALIACVSVASWLVNAEEALCGQQSWIRSLSYDDIKQRPIEVMCAMFEAMGLDPTRVSADAIVKTMGQDSQANSSISRKALEERNRRKAAHQHQGAGVDPERSYDECMCALRPDIEYVVRAIAAPGGGAAQGVAQSVARGVGLSAPLLACKG